MSSHLQAKPFRFALYSDLHLELMRNGLWQPPPLDVNVVILAGDIGNRAQGLAWAAETFAHWPGIPAVVYVAGNHEYYDASLSVLDELRQLQWQETGVHFLENATLELLGVRILGCTLWSGFDLYGKDYINVSMAQAQHNINDYWIVHDREGERLTPQATLQFHRESVQWLDAELSKPFDGKTIVVTHFAPHRRCVAPHYEGSDLSPYFVTDLAWLMEKHRIDVWAFGHTHTNVDFVAENGCRVISNQMGYRGEAVCDFLPELLIEV